MLINPNKLEVQIELFLWLIVAFCSGVIMFSALMILSEHDRISDYPAATNQRLAQAKYLKFITTTEAHSLSERLTLEEIEKHEKHLLELDEMVYKNLSDVRIKNNPNIMEIAEDMEKLHLETKSVERQAINMSRRGEKTAAVQILSSDSYTSKNEAFISAAEKLTVEVNKDHIHLQKKLFKILICSLTVSFAMIGIVVYLSLKRMLFHMHRRKVADAPSQSNAIVVPKAS